MHYNLHVSSRQNKGAEGTLFNFELTDNIKSKLKVSHSGFIGYKNSSLLYSNKPIKTLENKADPICLVHIKKDNFNVFFNKTEFITSSLLKHYNWLVIKDTNMTNTRNDTSSQGFRLKEGDVIRLGKMIFKIRELSQGLPPSQVKDCGYQKDNEDNREKDNNKDSVETMCIETKEKDVLIINKESSFPNSIHIKEGANCRICQGNTNTIRNPLISICKCTGSNKFIHLSCFLKWSSTKLTVISISHLTIYNFPPLKCQFCSETFPDKLRLRKSLISLIAYQRPRGPYVVLEAFPSSPKEALIIFIFDMQSKSSISIGRSSKADIDLSDVFLSRNHAMLRYEDGNFYLEDLNSKFGSMVMIRRDLTLLPHKAVSVLFGRLICKFTLVTNFLSTLCCYSNVSLEKADYYHQLDEQKREMHRVELKVSRAINNKDAHETSNANQDCKMNTVVPSSTNNLQSSLMKISGSLDNSDVLHLLAMNNKRKFPSFTPHSQTNNTLIIPNPLNMLITKTK